MRLLNVQLAREIAVHNSEPAEVVVGAGGGRPLHDRAAGVREGNALCGWRKLTDLSRKRQLLDGLSIQCEGQIRAVAVRDRRTAGVHLDVEVSALIGLCIESLYDVSACRPAFADRDGHIKRSLVIGLHAQFTATGG